MSKKDDSSDSRRLKRTKLFHSNRYLEQEDILIQHLEQYGSLEKFSLGKEIANQIALDGLSGMTFWRLIKILTTLFKNSGCQDYIWSILVSKYLKNPPGSNIIAYYIDSNHNVDKRITHENKVVFDRVIKLPSQTIKRFGKIESTISPVQDGPSMGSCSNYHARSDITKSLIEFFDAEGSIDSFHSIEERYGLFNIYFVAHHEMRRKAIFPCWSDPNVDIKLREYCILELIGKSRTLGAVFPKDKCLGRYRIMLLAKGFISQYQSTSTSPIEHHLIRFAQNKTANCEELSFKPSEFWTEEEDSAQPLTKLCYNPGRTKVDRDILSTIYDLLAKTRGQSQLGVRRKLKLPKFHVRNHVKNLLAIRMIASQIVDNSEGISRVYKAAYKTNKWKTKRKKPDDLRGIMVNWDEKDIKAKRILGFRRSSFSQAEDSLLILCRITSLLIQPANRLSWCVHKHLIRDIMHQELIESQDKTSDSCLRRIKYLKRLPNNIMSINELTAELSDDSDVIRLTQSYKHALDNGDKLDKLFSQVLKVVRAKIPFLLGIPSTSLNQKSNNGKIKLMGRNDDKASANIKELDNYDELERNYELLDCQSVASIQRVPTYDKAKNVVDIRFNTVSLVTMAFSLSNCLNLTGLCNENYKKISIWLLDKFYSNYPDKLINSMLSKLNKRSLLTRKCPPSEQVILYKLKSKISLKLNQSVLFLLNRHLSSSLIQLVHPINQSYKFDLKESNEMASIALLTSFYSQSSFDLVLDLKIPANVVRIDQGSESFRTLCERTNKETRETLARFMNRCGQSMIGLQLNAGITSQDEAIEISNGRIGSDSESCPKVTKNMFASKVDDSRRALFLLRNELKSQALDKCGNLADCLIVQPCNLRFYSNDHLLLDSAPLDKFMNSSKVTMCDESYPSEQTSRQIDWLVKSFQFRHFEGALSSSDSNEFCDSHLESNKVNIEFSARLWKQLDGIVHLRTLFKLIESILSWVIVFPGVELDTIFQEFNHLMPDEHLLELLELIEELGLISSTKLKLNVSRPKLFGPTKLIDQVTKVVVTYEPKANSFVRYSQLKGKYCI